MKIFNEHHNIGLSPLAGASNKKAHAADQDTGKTPSKDSIDTSRMGNLMSKNAKDIISLKSVRQDKIEAYRHLVTDTPDFSNAVIDKILHRLTTS